MLHLLDMFGALLGIQKPVKFDPWFIKSVEHQFQENRIYSILFLPYCLLQRLVPKLRRTVIDPIPQ